MKLLRRPARSGLPERLDALAARGRGRRRPAAARGALRSTRGRRPGGRAAAASRPITLLSPSPAPPAVGKSTLFNALAGLELARVGSAVRRPRARWPASGARRGPTPLLEWLRDPAAPPGAAARASSTRGAGDALDGLVLLDLPDHDSTDLTHRHEVDRLVELVDLFVWVLDPQKYADAVAARALPAAAGRPRLRHGDRPQPDRPAPTDRRRGVRRATSSACWPRTACRRSRSSRVGQDRHRGLQASARCCGRPSRRRSSDERVVSRCQRRGRRSW